MRSRSIATITSSIEVRTSSEEMETTTTTTVDEYEKLVIQMHDTPSVVIDNAACPATTVVKVDSASNHQGLLLEAVQALTDLDLTINKAYFSSDGRWFMDVFHVTDRCGRKLTDDALISFIQQSLCKGGTGSLISRSDVDRHGLTVLELTGADRPGLISEIFALLADLQCSVQEAKLWTHNDRVAFIISILNDESGAAIRHLESRLTHVLKGSSLDARGARAAVTSAAVLDHADRRLHQMMDADWDYHPSVSSPPAVSVHNWVEREYSVVSVLCEDRGKLLFDMVCALTNMDYTVFHGSISTYGDQARQEFYIRHTDGSPISSDAERQRVIQRLQAAIQRRSSEGLRLELKAENRPGLRAEVTRAFRENGVRVRRAEMLTDGKMANDVFYLTDMAGCPANLKAIDAVLLRIGAERLKVKGEAPPRASRHEALGCGGDGGLIRSDGRVGLLNMMGSLVMRNLWNLGLIRSCSLGMVGYAMIYASPASLARGFLSINEGDG